MTTVLIIVVIVVLVAAAGFFVKRQLDAGKSRSALESTRGSSEMQPFDPLGQQDNLGGNPLEIKAGDMVATGGDKAFIRGSLRISEGGYHWTEHFFEADSSGQRRWLSVEEDPDVQVAVWHDRPDVEVNPDAQSVEVDGTTFRRVERGRANYRSEATTGLPQNGTLEYVDFESSDGRMLGLERFDNGSWEVSVGESVGANTLTIYPGS